MNNCQLNEIENIVLTKIKEGKYVFMIPVDIYSSILYHSIIQEDYETCVKLRGLIDKVKLKTTFSFFDEFIDQSKFLKV